MVPERSAPGFYRWAKNRIAVFGRDAYPSGSRSVLLHQRKARRQEQLKHRLLSGVLGNNPRDHLLSLAVYAIIYFAAYRYGMTFLSAHPSPIWFPDSVLLCALLLAPKATWWIYVLIPLPIRLFTSVPADTPTWFLFVCYVNDVLKGLLSAWILLR